MASADTRRTAILATTGVLAALVALNAAAWFTLRCVRLDVTE